MDIFNLISKYFLKIGEVRRIPGRTRAGCVRQYVRIPVLYLRPLFVIYGQEHSFMHGIC